MLHDHVSVQREREKRRREEKKGEKKKERQSKDDFACQMKDKMLFLIPHLQMLRLSRLFYRRTITPPVDSLGTRHGNDAGPVRCLPRWQS